MFMSKHSNLFPTKSEHRNNNINKEIGKKKKRVHPVNGLKVHEHCTNYKNLYLYIF